MKNNITIFRDNLGQVELIKHVGSDQTVVNRPATADALSESDKDAIQRYIEHNQLDTLKQCSVMLKIKAPLFVAKEHMALADWNCNEINKNYADADTKFYEPGVYREHMQENFQQRLINPVLQSKVRLARFRVYRTTRALNMHHEAALRLYQHMIEAGICREQASGVLPQNVYVEYYAAASLDCALGFADRAEDPHVLPELREVATVVTTFLQSLFPVTTDKWERSTKKKKINVERRLAKLAKALSLSESLNNGQIAKLQTVQATFSSTKEKKENKKEAGS